MPLPPTEQKRLELLNEAQPQCPWQSCAEKRQCLVCENIFTGHEVVMPNDEIAQLSCSACGSGPEFWMRPGNPLLDESVWAEWEVAIAATEKSHDEDEFATV